MTKAEPVFVDARRERLRVVIDDLPQEDLDPFIAAVTAWIGKGRTAPIRDAGEATGETGRRVTCPTCQGASALRGPLGVEPCGVCGGRGHVVEPPDESLRRYWLMEIEPRSGALIDNEAVLTDGDLRTVAAALKADGRPVLARRIERLTHDLGDSRVCAGKWRR